MAPLFRTMLLDESDGLPTVGPDGKQLGVRVPQDVRPIDGLVHPERSGRAQGMSVTTAWQEMDPRLIPERLGGHALAGQVFVIDSAAFVPPLTVRPERPPHHVVGPRMPLPLGELRDRLAATRNAWSLLP